jgi:hypothetical protein
MSQILIDLPETQATRLAERVEIEHRPREAIICEAIGTYLAGVGAYLTGKTVPPPDVFGLWKNEKADGLAYQEALRGEWGHREQ